MAGKPEAQFPVGGGGGLGGGGGGGGGGGLVGWWSEGYGPAFAGELRS